LAHANEIATAQRQEILHRIEDFTKQHQMQIKSAIVVSDISVKAGNLD
jgi:hypothetical protein